MSEQILLTVDYHDAPCMIRRKNLATGRESVKKVPTERDTLRTWMLTAAREAKAQRGRAGCHCRLAEQCEGEGDQT